MFRQDDGCPMHIFISYKRDDQNYAHKLAGWLIDQGFQVWIDDTIEPGENWQQSIFQAIKDCAAMIVIMTPEAEASLWVQREVALAEKWDKPVFPLLLEGENWPSFVLTQYVDVRNDHLPLMSFCDKLATYTRRKKNESANVARVATPVAAFELPPPFEWIDIPAGEVSLEDATPRRGTKGGGYEVGAFKIAKYPVTNAQYDMFVNDPQGYVNSIWWNYSSDANEWRGEHPKPLDTAFPGTLLPRTNVSWYDAVAFCRWLTTRLNGINFPVSEGRQGVIMLPTEQQWQRAAQGDDGRKYPWGNEIDPTRCNYGRNVEHPTPVTQYPSGISPYGVMDMCGNVWEWCLTEWGSNAIGLTGSVRRVLRGGSWGRKVDDVRCAYRARDGADRMSDNWGFRVVRSASMP